MNDAELEAMLLKFEEIAKKRFNIPTLKRRGSDSLDFHDVGVTSIYRALADAYIEGLRMGSDITKREYHREINNLADLAIRVLNVRMLR